MLFLAGSESFLVVLMPFLAASGIAARPVRSPIHLLGPHNACGEGPSRFKGCGGPAMSRLARIHDVLAGSDQPIADAALAEALPTARGDAAERIIETLLRRRQPRGLAGIVEAFDLLPRELQDRVMERADELKEGLRLAARGSSDEAHRGVIEIIDRGICHRFADVLVDLLQRHDASTARAAAATLESLAQQILLDASAQAASLSGCLRHRENAHRLARALAEACRGFDRHRRRDVLMAAMRLLFRHDPELIEAMTDPGGGAVSVLDSTLRRADTTLSRKMLLNAAALPGMQAAVTAALGDNQISDSLGEVLNRSFLVAIPVVADTVGQARKVDHLAADSDMLRRVDEAACPHLGRWVCTLHRESDSAIDALDTLVLDTNRTVRLSGLRSLMRLETADADALIATMCFDPEPALACIALRHLKRRRWPDLPRVMMRLAGASEPRLRHLSEQFLGSFGFDRFWNAWPDLSSEARQLAGRALIKVDPDFHRQLLAQFNARDAGLRHRAVMVVRSLGQETYFEAPLVTAMEDEDERVVSAASAALAAIHDSPSVSRALDDALHHGNPRVRANAVEALERLDRLAAVRHALAEMLDDPNSRSRANAIKASSRLSIVDAHDALARMLNDPDDKHRISALWVFEQLASPVLARQVGSLAVSDPDPHVRSRALTTLRRLAAAGGEMDLTANADGLIHASA